MTALDDHLAGLGAAYRDFDAVDLALANGAAVASWTSATGEQATQATSAKQPTYRDAASSLIAGHAAVRFDGLAQYLLLPNADATTFLGGQDGEWTLAVVAAPSDTTAGTGGRALIGAGRTSSTAPLIQCTIFDGKLRIFRRSDGNEGAGPHGPGSYEGSTTVADDTPGLFMFRYRNRELSSWYQGGAAQVLKQPNVTAAATLDRLAMGAVVRSTESVWFAGDIARWVLIDEGLHDDDVEALRALMEAQYAVGSTTLPDRATATLVPNSYGQPFSNPQAQVIGGKVYATGVRSDGMTTVLEFGGTGESWSIEKRQADDHNVGALLWKAGKAPIAFYYEHTGGSTTIYRRGTAADTVDLFGARQTRAMGGNTDYVHAHADNPDDASDNLITFSRVDARYWRFTRSTDWGANWAAVVTLVDFGSGNQGYLRTAQVGTKIRVGAWGHATLSTFPYSAYFEIDTATGAITSAAGTVLANLDGTGLPLTDATLPVAFDAPGTRTGSVMAVGPHAGRHELVIFEANAAQTADFTYTRAWWDGAAWQTEPIGAAGVGFTYSSTKNPGGAEFSPDVPDRIYTARNVTEATWTVERLDRQPGGTWDATVLLSQPATDGKLMRPVPLPEDAPYELIVRNQTLLGTVSDPGDFTVYAGDTLALARVVSGSARGWLRLGTGQRGLQLRGELQRLGMAA